MVKRSIEGGFTLIEAVVALVIMATALTGLYSWVNTELISLRRAEAIVVTQELAQEALRQIQLTPLASQPQGEAMLGGYRMTWSATLAEPGRNGLDGNGRLSLYDVTLYDVVFRLHSTDEELGEWSVRQVRYEQVRQPEYERRGGL